jgi:prepilin-type N-terminal cleavage/methylation domain-containing protein/prepilin-type processing-associated H-X9-DG protein
MKATHITSRGFSLMESLVVMSILAILVTLAVPFFKSARLAGAQAQTAGNMRGIGVALQNYIADHNGTLPGPTTVAVFNVYLGGIHSAGATPCGLQQYLGPYLDQKAAPWQPATSDYVHVPMMDFPALSPLARATDGVAQYVKLDYGASSVDNRFGEGAQTMADAATKAIQPKRVAALTDTARRSAILSTADKQSWQSSKNTFLPDEGAFAGKRMYLFLDGSVEGPIAKPIGPWIR